MFTNIHKKFLRTSIIFAALVCFNPLSSSEYNEEDGYRVCCKLPDVSHQHVGPDTGFEKKGIFDESKRWLNGTVIYYHFLEGDEKQKQAVRAAFKEWKDIGIGLAFEEEPKLRKSQIKIGFDLGDDSWSLVGTDTLRYAKDGKKSMNLAAQDLTTPYGHRTALHEIGHALGFEHEHQNPSSGIVWDEDAVYKYFEGSPNEWKKKDIERNVLTKLTGEQFSRSAWDPKSIMHYGFKAGLIKTPIEYQKGLLRPLELSEGDKELVQEFYPLPLELEPDPEAVKNSLLKNIALGGAGAVVGGVVILGTTIVTGPALATVAVGGKVVIMIGTGVGSGAFWLSKKLAWDHIS